MNIKAKLSEYRLSACILRVCHILESFYQALIFSRMDFVYDS